MIYNLDDDISSYIDDDSIIKTTGIYIIALKFI